MAQFYAYLWLRDNGTPYYVGKGSNRRAFEHHARIGAAPPACRIIVQEFENEKEAFEAERLLISIYGRKQFGGLLCNLTDGGEGPVGSKMTPEWCARNRELAIARGFGKRRMSPDEIERMRKRLTGKKRPQWAVENMRQWMLKNNPFRGKKHAEETRLRMREAALKRYTKNPNRLKEIGALGRLSRWGVSHAT